MSPTRKRMLIFVLTAVTALAFTGGPAAAQ